MASTSRRRESDKRKALAVLLVQCLPFASPGLRLARTRRMRPLPTALILPVMNLHDIRLGCTPERQTMAVCQLSRLFLTSHSGKSFQP